MSNIFDKIIYGLNGTVKPVNNHLCKMITRLRRPMLSRTQQIFIQSLLYKTTTCLTRPLQNITQWRNRKQKLSNIFKII